MSDNLVPHLSSTAIVPVNIGANLVSYLQLALSQLSEGVDHKGLTDRISAGTVSDPKELSIVGLSSLLATIYQVAHDKGFVTMRPLDINGLQ